MKKALWFSRHEMTDAQKNDIVSYFKDDVVFEQVNKTITSIDGLAAEIERNDVLCVVMPLELQAELFGRIRGTEKRLFVPVSHRVPNATGGFDFVHAGWKEVRNLIIETETITSHPKPEGAVRSEGK